MRKFPINIEIKKIDKYIVKKFLFTYVFLLVIIIAIAIIFDINERIDKLAACPLSAWQIAKQYYVPFAPYFANLFSPLFVFIAVIFFTSNLAGKSEIIAMKAAGMSFNRLLRPYMFCAAIIALSTFLLGAYVIPRGNKQRVDFDNMYFKKRNIFSEEVTNVQMQVDTGVVAFVTRFDYSTKRGTGFSLDKFEHKQLVSRLTADVIQYDTLADHKYCWKAMHYRIRTLHGMREKLSSGIQIDTIIKMEPSDFYYLKGQQETLTQPELGEFIDRQKLRGAAGVALFEVEYHKRIAMAFAAFILTIIGASLSCEKRKGGMGTSIGIGLALAFGYILFQTISSTFATNSGLPAVIAEWIPNILFAIIAYVLYRQTPQ